ncbi:MAG: carbohydrate binding family 9 domain-containing protein [bacterium]|nr:carbohydrate binding family 9 domain-containing protein [bacterium]
MIKYIAVIVTVIVFLFGVAGTGLEAQEKKAVEIPVVDTPPGIDGELDEPIWQTAAQFTGFKSFSPNYGIDASAKSIIYVCTDRENFYFAARCFQEDTARIKATVTSRDKMYGDDWVSFNIDTFNNNQSGYGFYVNPFGIQGDGILGSDGGLDSSHDMVWYSKGTIDDKGYVVEVKVPFKSIRFPVKKRSPWGCGW